MRKVSGFFLGLLACLIITPSLASNIKIELAANTGTISRVWVVQGRCVFEINTQGKLNAISCVDSAAQAKSLLMLADAHWPQQVYTLPNAQLPYRKTYLNLQQAAQYKDVSFYRTAFMKHWKMFNAIEKVNDISMQYYVNNIARYKQAGIVGEIKTIADIDIKYYLDSNSGYTGKISKIGDVLFRYEMKSRYSKQGNYVGQFSSIGNIPMYYHQGWQGSEQLKGKLKNIGKVKVKYLSKLNLPSVPATMYGQFDQITGSDRRFILSVPY